MLNSNVIKIINYKLWYVQIYIYIYMYTLFHLNTKNSVEIVMLFIVIVYKHVYY